MMPLAPCHLARVTTRRQWRAYYRWYRVARQKFLRSPAINPPILLPPGGTLRDVRRGPLFTVECVIDDKSC